MNLIKILPYLFALGWAGYYFEATNSGYGMLIIGTAMLFGLSDIINFIVHKKTQPTKEHKQK